MSPALREGGRLVVVGGDAAGMSAASRARRLRPEIEIVVLEKGRDVSYSACSTPYYIAGLIEERDALIAHDAEFFRLERRIDMRLEAEAVALDAKRREVTYRTSRGAETIGFDALVMATGATPVKTHLPGSELRGVFTLRTLVHADAIRDFLATECAARATVLGGGYVGLEMAEALRSRGLMVTVLEALPHVLSSYDPDMSELVERELLSKGVAVSMGAKIDGFEPGADGRRVGYVLAKGQRLATDLVLVAVGVRPETRLASSAGIELGRTGAIKVDGRQVTSEASILAAGDCAEAMHIVTGRPAWIPLGTTANKQGRIAGENATGGNARFAGVAGTNVTKVLDLEVAQTGLSSEAARHEGFHPDSVRITGSSRSHAYPGASPLVVKLVFEKGTGRVLGAQMVGNEGVAKRIDVVATALAARMAVADLEGVDMSYAPPFSPVWDPVLIAAREAVKKVAR
jgi:NADPH-dependent 2,4-dienoyl-CoA reductase/sulfur reductase-like enzyme